MNSFRLLRGPLAALAVGLLGLGLEGCAKCGPGNCTGCCDANQQCQLAAADHCGVNGGACSTCLSVQQCIAGACQFAGSSGNGSGSGSGSSSSSTSSTSSSTSGTVSGSSTASGSSSTTSTNGSSVSSGSGASSGTTGTCDCTVCTNSGLVCNPSTCTCSAPTSSSSGGTTGSCDCTSCTNAGLGCDTTNCTCIVPTNTTGTSGTTSTNSSAGTTTGTSGTTSTNSSAGTTTGTSSGTTNGTTTGTSGSSFCSSLGSTPSINNGGIGNPCTPNDTQFPDGGSQPTQGSCTTTGQYCYTLFNNDQPRCWSFCTTANAQGSAGGCPNDAYCYDFGPTSSGQEYLSCQPIGAANNAGCPSGYVTLFVPSPDPASINLCGPSCTQSSDCNGSSGTNYTCTGGKCHCSNATTDCAPGALCDSASGACYFPCTSNNTCNVTDGGQPLGNCCAQSGSIHFCDGVGVP